MVYMGRATLRKHPIRGVILGGATVVLIGYLIYSGWLDARTLLGQKAPDRISIHQAVNLRGVRWVTILDGQWHCDRAITIARRSIKKTEVPITGAIEGEVLIVSLRGDSKCAERAGASLTGVVGSKVLFRSRGTLQRWGRSGHRVAVLDVNASPRFALIMLLAAVAVAALAIGVFGYHLREMLRSGRESARLPSYDPIQ